MVHTSPEVRNKQAKKATKHQCFSQLFPSPRLCARTSGPCSTEQARLADAAFPGFVCSPVALSTRTAASSTRVNTQHSDTVYIKSTLRNFDINVSFHKNNVMQCFSSLPSVIWCITITFQGV